MSYTLTDLVTRLTLDVPAQDGIPTNAQYTQAVKDAVADLGRRAPVVRTALLAIVGGTASYALPADFQQFVRLNASDVLYPAGSAPWGYLAYGYYGGYDMSYPYRAPYNPFDAADRLLYGGAYAYEQVAIAGGNLLFYPTPTENASRQLVYFGGDALVSGTYATLTDDRAQVALLLASALCLERLASSPRADAIKLSTGQDTAGTDMLDTTQRAAGLRGTVLHLREQYTQAVSVLIRAGGLSL